MINNQYNNGCNAAQAFSSIYANNQVNSMASHYNIIMSASTPGLPQDSFNRTQSIESGRFFTVDKSKQWLKDIGQLVSNIGLVSKLVSFIYPPAAAISSVSEIAAPTLVSFAGDTSPKPVVYNTSAKYNPWIR